LQGLSSRQALSTVLPSVAMLLCSNRRGDPVRTLLSGAAAARRPGSSACIIVLDFVDTMI
jgi:hypothetical protein